LVHEGHNLITAIGVGQFVMQAMHQLSREFKTADKRCDAFSAL
jgi:hypothetical protein